VTRFYYCAIRINRTSTSPHFDYFKMSFERHLSWKWSRGTFSVIMCILLPQALCETRKFKSNAFGKGKLSDKLHVEGVNDALSNFVSSANPDLKALAFDEDYDFNIPPYVNNGPVEVNVSLNLRNILQVRNTVKVVEI
jgi:hypothetical protein